MISVSISAAAATRKLGFWTNFGIMARDAPPRPITPTPKTRSLPAISALLSRAARAWHLRVLMTIQARRNCPDLPAVPGTVDDKPLLRAGVLIYISTLVQCVQNVQVVQIDSGFFPTASTI